MRKNDGDEERKKGKHEGSESVDRHADGKSTTLLNMGTLREQM